MGNANLKLFSITESQIRWKIELRQISQYYYYEVHW